MSVSQDDRIQSLVEELHRTLAGKFGIAGFGASEGALNVYRSAEHPEAEQAVRSIVDQRAPGIPIRMMPAGGKFKAF